ncbi:MAG: type II toxin-antitoxin system VapC family toxin [Acidobacteriota bacterium]
MVRVFIDSNIPMYVAGGDHPNQELAVRFMQRVRAREVDACSSSEVLQEILWRYVAIGKLKLARSVYDLFVDMCPVVLPVTLADTDKARDLLCGGADISARDAVHAAVMLNHDIEWIATFDADFDRIHGIRRMKLK